MHGAEADEVPAAVRDITLALPAAGEEAVEVATANAPGWSPLLAGAFAGLLPRVVMYPLDTVKARLQCQSASAAVVRYRGALSAAAQIARVEGLPSFYKGMSAVLLGSMPGNMAYFGGYEIAQKLLKGQQPGLAADMATGAIAQLVGGLVFTPTDIIKERLQVMPILARSYTYSGPWHVLRSLVQQQGPLGLFKGYWVTNSVWIPWNILYMSGYSQSKRAAAEVLGLSSVDELSPATVGVCSALSAGAAGVLTHPLDVVKTRLQVLSANKGPSSTWAIVRDLLKHEGPKVFLTGIGLRTLSIAPGTAMSWMLYEPIKRMLSGGEQQR